MNFRWRLNFLFLVCLFLRLCFIGKYLDSCDSVDFALGLRDYDLSQLQPHFPGYPVYICISRLFYKLLHDDVWALALPGILFGSLTVYPLSFLARQLFSEKVATLTTILYLINPLCWLQAEKPTSDAMALFFIVLSAYFFYRACNSHVQKMQPIPAEAYGNTPLREVKNKKLRRIHFIAKNLTIPAWCSDRNCLFWGSLVFGFGLGVRLSYFPFIALWIAILLYKKNGDIYAIFYGLLGIIVGVCSWFLPQIGCVGCHSFFQHGFLFSYGHFTDWGGSVITLGGLERIALFIKSLWVCGLGGWWYDTSFLRSIPSLIITISFFYFFRHCHVDRRRWFLGFYAIPYLLWVILGQNVANPRHIMPIIPILLILVAYGLCKVREDGYQGVFQLLSVILIISMSVMSFKLVIQYHTHVPAPIQLIQFIERQFTTISTRIYCNDEKRFFDYYAPQWDVRTVRDMKELITDMKSSLGNPHHILFIHKPGKIEQFGETSSPIIKFEGNPYTDGTRAGLLLFELTDLYVR